MPFPLRGVDSDNGGEFVNEEGADILFRSILLPLSRDGETLDHLFGGANFKIKDQS